MINAKKLIKLARKWQKMAGLRRKTITQQRSPENVDSANCSTSSCIVDKGYFVVYTADQKRFVFPLVYLKNEIFMELLKIAEEEFGLQRDGPITLPFDAITMDYAISLIQKHAAKDLERALVMSITYSRCSSSSFIQQEKTNHHLLICSI